jgi:hypothetical protein
MSEGYMQGDKDTGITVPFSDDSEEKEGAELLADDDKPAASPEEEKTRRQKRKERITRLLNEGKQSKEEVERLKGELAELKANQARLEGYVAAKASQPQPKDTADPYQARLDAIEKRRKEAWAAAQAEMKAGALSEERAAYYESVSREIEEAKAEIYAERVLARRAPQQQQDAARQYWVNQYPEVYRDQRAFQWAQARYHMRQAEGEAVTDEVAHEILQEARTRFKLGPKKPPSASEKSRFSGVAASGSSGSPAANDNGIPMRPEFKRMATALYSDLPEAEAIKKWVNGPGKKLRANKVL